MEWDPEKIILVRSEGWYKKNGLVSANNGCPFPENQNEFSEKRKKVLTACFLYSSGLRVPSSLLEFLKGAMTNSDDSHRMKLRKHSIYLE